MVFDDGIFDIEIVLLGNKALILTIMVKSRKKNRKKKVGGGLPSFTI